MEENRTSGDPSSKLLVERTDYGARLTMNRPRVSNAADLELWRLIGEEFDRLAGDPSIRAIVITGAGDRAFMAGAEIGEFPDVLAEQSRTRGYLATVTNTLNLIEEIPVPVIAEMNGAAIGGGLELAVACDYRLTVESAKFGIPSASVGLAIAYPDIERLVALVGTGKARELLLFGKTYSATEALAMGLVNEIVGRDQLRQVAEGMAADIAGKAALSLASAKQVLRSIVHGSANPSNEFIGPARRSIDDAWDSAEFRQRVDQMLKRKG